LGPRPRRFSPAGFFLEFFFYGDWSLRTGHPPSPRVDFLSASSYAVLISPKGAESPGSRRIGVTGALVLILPSETV